MRIRRAKPVLCTDAKPTNVITEPNLSRSVRQILDDTVRGLPSPAPLTPLPEDSRRGITEDDMHSLRVVEDKFDAINSQREVTRTYEKKVRDAKKAESAAVEKLRREHAELLLQQRANKERSDAAASGAGNEA